MQSEEQIAKEAIIVWTKFYNSKKNSDYDFNLDQVDKMNEIIAYCQEFEKIYPNCSIVRCELTPKYIQGSIELLVEGEWAIGELPDSIGWFKRIISLCDGINIEPFGDNFFHITFFIENLYKKIV